jgi:hypothetical protein
VSVPSPCPVYSSSREGRHSHLVVRLDFKSSRGCQTLPGRFDSGCLPPCKASRLFQHLPQMSSRSLILKRFMGGDVLAASAKIANNFHKKYG